MEQKCTLISGHEPCQILALLITNNRILRRIEEHCRNKDHGKQAEAYRDGIDFQVWEIWRDYQRGKYGTRVSSAKHAVKDLLENPRTHALLASLRMTSVKSLKEAIRRTERRIKKTNVAGG